MKKFLWSAVFILAVGSFLRADWVYNQNIVTNSPVSYTQNYVLNLNNTPNQTGISRVAAQAVISSATLNVTSFQDGRVATGTVTLSSNNGLVATQATDTITIAPTASILAQSATDQITVVSTSGLTNATITFNGAVLKNGRDWFATSSSATTAASIATALQGFQTLQVSRVNNVIFATATYSGTAANSYTLTSSVPSSISVSSGLFSGGHDAPLTTAILTINGYGWLQGRGWNVVDTSSGTATSIAALVNNISGLQASATGSVVTVTATTAGAAGNSFTMSSSKPIHMTVATANFTGGLDNAYLMVNTTKLVQGTAWTRTSTSSGTAKAISDSINANSTLNKIVTSVWTAAASSFTITSNSVGLLSNYATIGSPAAISPAHATLTGGVDSNYTIGSPVISIANNGYATGVSLILTGSAPPAPLSANTTYYAISVDANDIELATSLANAKAGTFITLTSSSTTGPHVTTLTPSAFTGSAGIQWQSSNDCITYTNLTSTSGGVAIASVTFATPYTASVTNWDFGPVNYKCIQAAVTAPTSGSINLQIQVNGKNL